MGVHAGVVCRLGVLGKGIGGERDDGDIGCIDLLAQTNRAGCLIAVHVRHHNVHQDRIEAAGGMRQVQIDDFVAVDGAGDHDALGF